MRNDRPGLPDWAKCMKLKFFVAAFLMFAAPFFVDALGLRNLSADVPKSLRITRGGAYLKCSTR
jgi:hypothetical protein